MEQIKLDYSDIHFADNGKLKLLIIVGTRPEIIRLAAVINKKTNGAYLVAAINTLGVLYIVENGNTVKVTNHSNVDVKATFTYAAESGNTLTGAFTYDNSKTADSTGAVSLAKGVEGQVNAADYVTATLKLSGTPSNTMTDFTKVGTITVKITK